MRADASPVHPDTYGRYLFLLTRLAYPHTAVSGNPLAAYPVPADNVDQHSLQGPHISMVIDAIVRPQVDDRVGDQLAWAVIGHIAPAVNVEHGDAFGVEAFLADEDMIPAPAPAAGVGMGVLQK